MWGVGRHQRDSRTEMTHRINRYSILFMLVTLLAAASHVCFASYNRRVLRSETLQLCGPEAERLIGFLDQARIVSDKIVQALSDHDYTTAHSLFTEQYKRDISVSALEEWYAQFERDLHMMGQFEYRNQHFQSMSSRTGNQAETGTQFYYVYEGSDLSPGWFLYISIIRDDDQFMADSMDIVSYGLRLPDWLKPGATQQKDQK